MIGKMSMKTCNIHKYRYIGTGQDNDHFILCVHLQCGSLQLHYLPLALEGAELIIWEELERIELRLEEDGLG